MTAVATVDHGLTAPLAAALARLVAIYEHDRHGCERCSASNDWALPIDERYVGSFFRVHGQTCCLSCALPDSDDAELLLTWAQKRDREWSDALGIGID